jgi:hypothetical protein
LLQIGIFRVLILTTTKKKIWIQMTHLLTSGQLKWLGDPESLERDAGVAMVCKCLGDPESLERDAGVAMVCKCLGDPESLERDAGVAMVCTWL